MKSKVKKLSKKWYDKKCMEVAKEIVHLRDRDICQKCEKHVTGSNCQCSHIISDWSDTRMSVDPDNMKILCYYCHLNWRHKQPIEATKWFMDKFPWRYEMLKERQSKQDIGSISLTWRENTYDKLIKERDYLLKTQ